MTVIEDFSDGLGSYNGDTGNFETVNDPGKLPEGDWYLRNLDFGSYIWREEELVERGDIFTFYTGADDVEFWDRVTFGDKTRGGDATPTSYFVQFDWYDTDQDSAYVQLGHFDGDEEFTEVSGEVQFDYTVEDTLSVTVEWDEDDTVTVWFNDSSGNYTEVSYTYDEYGYESGGLGFRASSDPENWFVGWVENNPLIEITGTVLLDGSGVEDVRVVGINDTEGEVGGAATTAGDGSYSFGIQEGDVCHVIIEYEDGGDWYNAESAPFVAVEDPPSGEEDVLLIGGTYTSPGSSAVDIDLTAYDPPRRDEVHFEFLSGANAITGTVTDTGGTPIQGATIRVVNTADDNPVNWTYVDDTTTDSNGEYEVNIPSENEDDEFHVSAEYDDGTEHNARSAPFVLAGDVVDFTLDDTYTPPDSGSVNFDITDE